MPTKNVGADRRIASEMSPAPVTQHRPYTGARGYSHTRRDILQDAFAPRLACRGASPSEANESLGAMGAPDRPAGSGSKSPVWLTVDLFTASLRRIGSGWFLLQGSSRTA